MLDLLRQVQHDVWMFGVVWDGLVDDGSRFLARLKLITMAMSPWWYLQLEMITLPRRCEKQACRTRQPMGKPKSSRKRKSLSHI